MTKADIIAEISQKTGSSIPKSVKNAKCQFTDSEGVVLVGPAGEEIFTSDKFGRVKVQFAVPEGELLPNPIILTCNKNSLSGSTEIDLGRDDQVRIKVELIP